MWWAGWQVLLQQVFFGIYTQINQAVASIYTQEIFSYFPSIICPSKLYADVNFFLCVVLNITSQLQKEKRNTKKEIVHMMQIL